MNIYTTKFFARCPANGARIEYDLKIQTGKVIPVEDINDFVDNIKQGFHEDIADSLAFKFGGAQVLIAHHHGVGIETIRPHLAHWGE